MFRVLIVEDEYVIRQGLIQSIHWDALGLELAGEAENGQVALDILNGTSVDIVLTDMRMPVFDGRHMLQEIENRKLDCEIIVLSEYTDFAYMQEAIHAHVFDYLLKPVNIDELNTLFSRVIEKLKQKSTGYSKNDDLFELFRLALSSDRQNTQSGVTRYLSSHNDHPIIVSILLFDGEIFSFAEIQKNIESAPFESKCLMVRDGQEFAFLTLLPDLSPEQINYAYRAWLYDLCEQNRHIPCRIGSSEQKQSILHLFDAIDEAKIAISFENPLKNHINYHAVKELQYLHYDVPINSQQLTDLLKQGNDIHNKINHMFRAVFETRDYIYIPAARRMLMEFFLSLERCSQDAGKGINISALIGRNYLDRINQIEWAHSLYSEFETIWETAFHAIMEQETNTTDAVLRRVLQIVQSHYMDDLSLINFAQEYHINYIYLSRKFKECTGETFTNYLMQIRMNKARELIDHEGFSEKETAPLVGYTNPYYFISSYRKYFGLEESSDEK